MKNLLLLSFFALPLCANAQFSNGFAPVGAVWQDDWNQFGDMGKIFTTVTSSNTVGNTTYKTLHIENQRFRDTTTFSRDTYISIRNDSVWKVSAQLEPEKFLFDFGAEVDDIINIYDNASIYALVDSVKIIPFLGQQKRAAYYSIRCTNTTAVGYKTFVIVQDFGVINDRWNLQTMENAAPCLIICFPVEYTAQCYTDPNRTYPENCILATDEKAQNQANISIFPNPASDILKIKSTETIHNVKINDILGKIVIEKQENSVETTISVENLPKGAYFLRVNDIFVQKIVKN